MMAVCSRCKGTGEVPDRIRLECIGCQKPVWVSYKDNADLTRKCKTVKCAECSEPPA